ncbi:MAG TPA: substrate-binding domain-containing protein, partial [Pirellulaceae bacterium]
IDHKLSKDRIADSIETDEEQSTRVMARHLLELGHRRIACLSSRETESQAWSLRRRNSFEAAVRACPGADCRSWRLNQEGTDGIEKALEILEDRDLRPTAVFAVTDHEALYVYKAAEKLGLRIPHDISVAGFADLDFAEYLRPGLTTMRQRSKEIGRRAVECLLERLHDTMRGDEPKANLVDADLVIRESTARLVEGHPRQ